MSNKTDNELTRRDFLKTASVASMATLAGGLSGTGALFAAGSDTIKIGLIGCGGRGTGAAIDAVMSSPGVEIIAMADPFQDRIDSSLKTLREKVPAAVKVTPGTCFTGLDGYKKLLEVKEVNHIVTAAPPGFRPLHLQAAIEAGKNVFMEKPVAVDPVGVRSVIASSELAARKGLAIVAGTQRRHQARYLELMKRIRDGAIGALVGGQCYWNQGDLWVTKKTPAMSDMEWQCRNWLYFTWTSGDHIVEQHVHNIDVMNWAFDATPVKVMGMGGRQVRTATSSITSPSSSNTRTASGSPASAARPRAAPSASRRRSSGPGAPPSATARSAGPTPGSSRGTRPTRTSSSTPTSSPASGPASLSTRGSASPRARSAPSWAA